MRCLYPEVRFFIIQGEPRTIQSAYEKKTDTLWSLSNQLFSAISDVQKKMGDMEKYIDDIHQETISPWKRRKTQAFVV
jgi:hypothetical protein